MQVREVGSKLAVWLSVLCALTMTGIVVWREVTGRQGTAGTSRVPLSRAVVEWDQMVAVGHRIGSADAPIVVVEFADFECPYCRSFGLLDLPSLMAEYPGKIQVVYRHFPLPYHRFARLSAVAAECAAEQGQFLAMHDQLYTKQDSIGLVSMVELAQRAGIQDAVQFEKCLTESSPTAAVERDFQAGQAAGVTATPTVMVNGMAYDRPLTRRELAQVIDSLLQH